MKQPKGLYFAYKFKSPLEIINLVEEILKSNPNIEEIHIGHNRCGFCGEKIDSGKPLEMSSSQLAGKQVVCFHLCDNCYPKLKSLTNSKSIGRG